MLSYQLNYIPTLPPFIKRAVHLV
ncbi:rCG23651, partial [Rattus norvegicus]